MTQTATGGNNHPHAMDKSIPAGSLRGELTPPCSKSYAQRALAASLLADGRSVLHNLAYCDDTRAAVRCIETLGASVQRIDRQTLAVEGGLDPVGNPLFVGDSGVDIETARRAGVRSVGVTWGFRPRRELEQAGAQRLADTPADVLAALDHADKEA